MVIVAASEGNIASYAEAVKQWATAHETVPTKATRRDSAIIGSPTNVVMRATKLSGLRRANVFATRLHPNLTTMDLKSNLDSSLNLDVMVEQAKFATTYKSFYITCNSPCPKVFLSATLFDDGCTIPVTINDISVIVLPNCR